MYARRNVISVMCPLFCLNGLHILYPYVISFFSFAAWPLVEPVLRSLSQKEIGSPFDIPRGQNFDAAAYKAVDTVLAYLHHHGVLMYETRTNSVSMWSTLCRDALHEGSYSAFHDGAAVTAAQTISK